MSQIKKMKEELAYLKRFALDMRNVNENISSKIQQKNYDQACEEVFVYLRKHFESKIKKISEENPSVEATLTHFANEALNVVMEVRRLESQKTYGLQQQKVLVEEILKTTIASATSLHGEVEKIVKKELPKEVSCEVPPTRTKPAKPREPGQKIDKRISIERQSKEV